VDNEHALRAFMTRDRDEFHTLRQRIRRAKQKTRADMFISIQPMPFQRPAPRALRSMYYLNAAAVVGGSDSGKTVRMPQIWPGGISLEDKDDLLASVLLYLSRLSSLEGQP